MKRLSCVVPVLLLLLGCGSESQGSSATAVPAQPLVLFQEHSLKDVSPIGADTDDPEASFALIKLKYLEPIDGTAPEALARIKSHCHAFFFQDPTIGDSPSRAPFPPEPAGAMDELRNRFFSNFKADAEEMANLKYNLEQSMAVAFQGENLLSLEIAWDQYWGGAHGMSGKSHLVISTTSGETVPLSRVIRADAHRTLLKRLKKKAREHWRSSREALEDLDNQFAAIPVTENYWITDAGIGFYYGAGEIGAYAMGEFSPFFRWSEISDLVLIDGPAGPLLKKAPVTLIFVDALFLRAEVGDYNHVILGGHFEQTFSLWGFGTLSDAQESRLLADEKLQGRPVRVAYQFEKEHIPEAGKIMTLPVLQEISFPEENGLMARGGLIEKHADFEAVRDAANHFSMQSSAPHFVFTIVDIAMCGDSAAALALIQKPSEVAGESAFVLLERRGGKWIGLDYGSGIEPPEWYPFR